MIYDSSYIFYPNDSNYYVTLLIRTVFMNSTKKTDSLIKFAQNLFHKSKLQKVFVYIFN